jgi:hypothetical protein
VIVVMTLALGTFMVGLPWLSQRLHGRPMTTEEIQHWAQHAIGEYAPCEPLKGWQNYGDGLSKWLLLRVPTSKVADLKDRVIASGSKRQGFERIDDGDQMPTGGNPGASMPPLWWHPDALDDPDILHVRLRGGGDWFVFSRNSGLVYIYIWSD